MMLMEWNDDDHAYVMQEKNATITLGCYSPPPYKNLVLRFEELTSFRI